MEMDPGSGEGAGTRVILQATVTGASAQDAERRCTVGGGQERMRSKTSRATGETGTSVEF